MCMDYCEDPARSCYLCQQIFKTEDRLFSASKDLIHNTVIQTFFSTDANRGVLTTKPLEDVVQGHSYQVEDLIEAQKRSNS